MKMKQRKTLSSRRKKIQTKYYSSVTYKLPTPEGEAIITIVEDEGKIDNIFFSIGKAGSSVNAYCDAIARLVIIALKHETISFVLDELSSITSDRQLSTGKGVVFRSGVEVLYLALMDYSRDKNFSTYSRRPARMTTTYVSH